MEITLPSRFVVVDLETTGLKATEDLPLEIGIAVVNKDLDIIHMQSHVLIPEGWRNKLHANPFVEDMHTKSGLFADLNMIASTPGGPTNLAAVDDMFRNLLQNHWGLTPGRYPLCGSSIRLDRDFLEVHFPKTNSFFTYRQADISAIKEFCKVFNPALYAKLPEKEPGQHRVMQDIKNSINELRWYRDNFFWI